MSIETIVRCNYCQKVKGEKNHWWLIAEQGDKFSVHPASDTLIRADTDACSEECLKAALTAYIQRQLKSRATAGPFDLVERHCLYCGVVPMSRNETICPQCRTAYLVPILPRAETTFRG